MILERRNMIRLSCALLGISPLSAATLLANPEPTASPEEISTFLTFSTFITGFPLDDRFLGSVYFDVICHKHSILLIKKTVDAFNQSGDLTQINDKTQDLTADIAVLWYSGSSTQLPLDQKTSSIGYFNGLIWKCLKTTPIGVPAGQLWHQAPQNDI